MKQAAALRKHFCAVQSLGQCSADDLASLGQAEVARHLETALDACVRADFSASLGPAQEVVSAAWTLLQQTGWDHPAWREAYSLGQLCLAAAYLSLPSEAPLPAGNIAPTASSQDQPPSSKADQHKAADAATSTSSKDQPPSSKQDQHKSAAVAAKTSSRDQPPSSKPGQHRAAAGKDATQPLPAGGCPSMQAMQALDFASIMGAPAEFLGAVLDAVEPRARQHHQAMHSQHPGNASPGIQHQHCHCSLIAPDQQNVDASPVRQHQHQDGSLPFPGQPADTDLHPAQQQTGSPTGGSSQEPVQHAAVSQSTSGYRNQQVASPQQSSSHQLSQQVNGLSFAPNGISDHTVMPQITAPQEQSVRQHAVSGGNGSCGTRGAVDQTLMPQGSEPQGQQPQHEAARQNSPGSEQHRVKGRAARLGRLPCSPPQQLPAVQPEKGIPRRSVKGLTAAEFKKQYWKTDTPVIITGAMDKWEAMQHWPILDWWQHHHGHRTVPVELGTDSTDRWRETTMLIHTFMADYMHPSVCHDPDAEVVYIAQHPLFDQLPSLTDDFEQPALMGGAAVQMNAWIGTKGTVTPLHYDSYDNFLAQVAGYKYLRLYNRRQTPFLYVENGQSSVHKTRAQNNVSAVNVEKPDFTKHPQFAEAEHVECILCPGEMLFIPAKYWHFVRSLSPAMSINFWY